MLEPFFFFLCPHNLNWPSLWASRSLEQFPNLYLPYSFILSHCRPPFTEWLLFYCSERVTNEFGASRLLQRKRERERERRLSSRSITTVPAIKTIYIPYYAPLPHSARLPPFSPLPPALLDIGDDVIGPKEHWSGVKTRSVLTWLWWRIWLYSCGFAWFWLVRWGVVNILPRSFSIRSVSWALVVILISRSIRLP